MSEGLFVLLTLVTLLSTLERRWWLAGLAAGLASTVRPVGAFLILLPILEILINRERGALPRCLGAAAPWPLLQMALSAAVWGNPLVTVNGYVEKDISLPLESLTTHLLSAEVGLDKKALVLGSLALAITGAVGLALRRRRGLAGGRSLLIWQVLVILFCISLPSSWAFQSIDRFLVVIWPTTLIGLAPLLPRHRATHALLLVMLSALSAGIAIRWLVNLSKVFPFDERALPSALQVLGYN
jgi:hypothetical protein